MLVALRGLAMQQKQQTMAMMTKLNQFLSYTDTHPGATIMYKKSDACTNVRYLNECNAKCRVKGHHFTNSGPSPPTIVSSWTLLK